MKAAVHAPVIAQNQSNRAMVLPLWTAIDSIDSPFY